MNKNRVLAVIIEHLYNFKHNLNRVVDSFYWPLIDILLWGLTSVYVQKSGVAVPQFVLIILSGLVLWMVVWRSQYEITINLLEEMWHKNLVNLFSSPLTILEWIVAIIILGVIKVLITISFAALVIWWFYRTDVFSGLGWWFLPFLALLIMFGWIVGFVVAGLILRFGFRIEALGWTVIHIMAPFSAVFYPLNSLPLWAQKIGLWLPTSYIFEAMRSILLAGSLDPTYLLRSALITAVYLVLSILFFLLMFKQSRKIGLARLE